MTTLVSFAEPRRRGEAILWERDAEGSRDLLPVDQSTTLVAGQIVALNAAGNVVALALGTTDGTENAIGVAYDNLVVAGSQAAVVVITREAILKNPDLVFPVGATAAQIATTVTQLAALPGSVTVRAGV